MKMIDHENICGMGEDIQQQCPENGLDSKRIPGPGNSKFFDLSNRGLEEFPVYLLDACFCIQCLYLEGNLIEDLTECFFPSLPSLQWLDVRNNVLKSFPKSVANHPSLEVLLLEGNQIQVLPLELGLVPKLRGVQLSGNPITYPPQEILAKGVHSILEFLREEHSIQAPSPSTIRPISGPFYKRAELKDGLRKYKSNIGNSGQDKNSLTVFKKRASSSKLPLITVKGYKSDLDLGPPRPKTSVPVCQFKLSETPGQTKETTKNEKKELPDLSNEIRSVSNKILQLWPKNATLNTERCRTETKIRETLLKEMFMKKIREMLERQAEIMQRTKDEETLKKWRQNRAHLKHNEDSVEPIKMPYDTDPNYMTMLSRLDLKSSAANQQRHTFSQTKSIKNVDEEMSEIFKSLQKLEDSRKQIIELTPRTEQRVLNGEMQMLVQLQKKLKVLHFQNAHQEEPVLSLPVRGHSVRSRKNAS